MPLWKNFHNGKTHLASAIVDYVARMLKRSIKLNISILYTTSSELLSEIKYSFDNNSTEKVYNEYKSASLLIIDELGAENITDFGYEALYQIINYRYSNLLSIIFISNLNDIELTEKLDNRIMYRIYETCRGIRLTGKDYRLEKFKDK